MHPASLTWLMRIPPFLVPKQTFDIYIEHVEMWRTAEAEVMKLYKDEYIDIYGKR